MTTKMKALENYKKFLETYSGRELLKKHSLEEEGVWRIKGEDPNCDMGGYHHMPELGVVTGKLQDIIMYGANLPQFWQWGAGGSFELIGRDLPKIDAHSLEARAEMEDELKNLEEQVRELKRQLGKK
jgi:hypothetical protein